MTVLRELAARLGFQVDRRGFDEAERAVADLKSKLRGADTQLRSARGRFADAGRAARKQGSDASAGANQVKNAGGVMESLGKLAATAGLTHFLHSIIELGSDANETQNALSAMFGPRGQAEVTQWAETASKELGRSKYDLQNYAARLGSLIDPMIGSKEKAQEMAQTLAGLSVDMASFFNTTDEDAMIALRSGLSGETEPLKRYGIVLTDVVLQEYAHTQGISKRVQKMGIAEKTQLRYNYILKATKTAQGDAARTGNGYANATKALKGYLNDFAVDMARAVIPQIERFVRWARDGLASFKAFTQGTWLLESAMYTLAGVATLLAVDLAAPFVPIALAIGGLILLFDDLYKLFNGGRSLIGRGLDEMFGEGTADETVRTLRDTTRELFDLWAELPDWQASWELMTVSIEGVVEAIGAVIGEMMRLLTLPISKPKEWANQFNLSIWRTLDKIPGFDASKQIAALEHDQAVTEGEHMGRVRERGITNDPMAVTTTRGRIAMSREERVATIYADAQARKDAARKRREARQKADEETARKATGYEDPGLGMSVAPEVAAPVDPDRLVFGQARASSADWTLHRPAPAPTAPPMSSTPGTANMSVNVAGTQVTINGGNPAEVRRIVKETIEAERRKTVAAIATANGR